MSSAFNTALSALKANATAIDAVGHNLANLNTTGFKNGSVLFSDLVAAQGIGAASSPETGAGVSTPQVLRHFQQGSIQLTSGPLDAAIEGSGFFMVRGTQGNLQYTRDGSFRMDASGYLVNSSGLRVQGWLASAGGVTASGPVADIVISPAVARQAFPTTKLSVGLNLNALAAVGSADGSFSTPVEVVDSLGARHVVTFNFTKKDANSWDYSVTIPGETQKGGTAGTPKEVKAGTLGFDSNGQLTSPAASTGPIAISIPNLANGAADVSIDWTLYGADQKSLLTQFAQTSAASDIQQDGNAAANLTGTYMAAGGLVMGRYSNGSERALAQVGLALIRNPESLRPAGNNAYEVTAASATPVVGQAGAGGLGYVRGGALEGSTADIAREFTNLIQYQRGYQANSRVISTMSELTQETINLVR